MLSIVICPDLALDLLLGAGWDSEKTFHLDNLEVTRKNLTYLKNLIDENKITIYLHPTLHLFVRMTVKETFSAPEKIRQAMSRLSDYVSVEARFSLSKSLNEANEIFSPEEAKDDEELILVSAKLIEADAIVCGIKTKRILNKIRKLNPKYFRNGNIPIFSVESFVDYCQSQSSLVSKSSRIKSIVTTTPMGSVISLPQNSTPIDFAYKLHSRMANSCIKARVNGNCHPLEQPLQNGDMVEIIKGQRNEIVKALNLQSYDYDNFDAISNKIARTAFARKQIRKCLEQTYQKIGRDSLRKNLSKDQQKKINDILPIKDLLPNVEIKSENELTLYLGLKKISVNEIYKRVLTLGEKQYEQFFFAPDNKDLFRERKYEVATCCCPSLSDSITGVISALKKPIRVHSKDCRNIDDISSDHLIHLEWKCDILGVDLQLHLQNKPKVLRSILNRLEEDATLILNVHSIHPANGGKTSFATIKALVKEHNMSSILKNAQAMGGVLSIRVKSIKPLLDNDISGFL